MEARDTDAAARWREFLRDEDGAAAVEYGLIAMAIALATVGTLRLLAAVLRNAYTNYLTRMTENP